MRAGITQGRIGCEARSRHLGDCDALRQINAVMTRAKVGDEACDRDRHSIGRPEQFDPHERAGKRRVGRTREQRNEADRRE